MARPYEGAGLGLARTKSLARLHGETTTVESVPDERSTFTLYLPASDAA
ncbi:TPA: hypothetical protein DCE37_03920 [Candidatus Latescibacteria bacterium]|nr:hypothetical protein [Candidatus Latescibacterota bacterium]